MEVQKITGHKTLAMLLRYTQMYDNHVVGRLDETEDHSKPAEIAVSAPQLRKGGPEKEPVRLGQDSNVVLFRVRQSR